MSNSTKGFLHRLLYQLRPQLKSLLGVDSSDEIVTQLNAADEPTPDIGTPRPCNGITLPPRRKYIGASPPSPATADYIVSYPSPRYLPPPYHSLVSPIPLCGTKEVLCKSSNIE
ncbi:hypothetical protein ACS0PU_003812 [Formica fusca]